jgi:phenylalanyl-tRNA synthetase beta chain
MLVPLNWLRKYVDIPVSPQELADRLTMAGFEVEEVTYLGRGLENVVVGKIVEVEKHPQADRLSVCTVDAGEKGTYQVVCGAPNVEAGKLGALALPGAKLPSGIEIREAKIRGVDSSGMLCAPDELGLPGGHEGLLLLEDAHPGQELTAALGLDDWVLDIDVLPNRPDCLSMVGIAREVAAVLGTDLKLSEPKPKEEGEPIEGRATVEVLAPDLCPRYVARFFTDVKVGPSPKWMAQCLQAAGMRPINNVVDITNFVMLEYGQPLHAFDFDKLEGGGLIVRRAKPGESMVTLDGQKREFTEEMLLIADHDSPACIAGIMGGDRVEVDEGTTTILLEAASFARGSVRRTSRSLGLSSESSQRFGRGVDPYLPALAIERAAELLEELCGAKTAKGTIDLLSPAVDLGNKTLHITQDYIRRVLGADISSSEVGSIFKRLDLEAAYDGERWTISIPPRRRDLEDKCDLLEEIARLWGFAKIPATLPSTNLQGAPDEKQAWEERASRSLLAMGLTEAMSYNFIGPSLLKKTNLQDTPLAEAVKITNPLSDEQSIMRTTVIPSLLQAAARNRAHQQEDLALFELGKTFQPGEPPKERRALGIVLMGRLNLSWWRCQESPVDFFTLKGVVERCLAALKVQGLQIARCGEVEGQSRLLALARALHPGRSAALLAGEEVVGIFGQISPKTAELWDLPREVQVAELDLELLWFLRSEETPLYQQLPRYPHSLRDLALLVPDETPAQKVEEIICSEGGELLEKIELFDLYAGSQVPAGMRSLAFRLQFGSKERTIQEQEIEELVAKILAKLAELGITLR